PLDKELAALGEVIRHVRDREMQIVERRHVADRAEQAHDHVVTVREPEGSHVARVHEQSRARDRRLLEHGSAGLDPLRAFVAARQPLEVRAGPAADVEHRPRTRAPSFDDADELVDLTLVVLVPVQEVVRPRRGVVGMRVPPLSPPPRLARYEPGYPARSRSLSSTGRSLRAGIPGSFTLAL